MNLTMLQRVRAHIVKQYARFVTEPLEQRIMIVAIISMILGAAYWNYAHKIPVQGQKSCQELGGYETRYSDDMIVCVDRLAPYPTLEEIITIRTP